MNSPIDIKRGTTPTLPITIYMPFENIKHIGFVFKREIEENHPALLKVSFYFSEISNEKVTVVFDETEQEQLNLSDVIEKETDFFIINLYLKDKYTRKLTKGIVYMDTMVTLNNGDKPNTEIVKLSVGETLFRGANER